MLKKQIEDAKKTRKAWAEGDAVRDSGIQIPEHIVEVRDIPYADMEGKSNQDIAAQTEIPCTDDSEYSSRWHKMDIYYPESMADDQKKPVIVSIHGGGWFYGDKELYRPYAMMLADHGFAVVNFNYRRSPEHKYPCGFLDVCKAMDHVARHADEYGLDLQQLYMVGDSVGAQLLSQYCIMAGNAQYRSNFIRLLEASACSGLGYTIEEIRNFQYLMPRRIALNCGLFNGAYIKEKEPEMCGWYLPEETDAFVEETFLKVLSYLDGSFPESYMMLSVNDGLSHHTAPMKARMEELGLKFTYREYGQDNPEDSHVFHLNHRSAAGARCNEEEIAFFRG